MYGRGGMDGGARGGGARGRGRGNSKPKNAFFFFMEDFKRREESKGNTFSNMNEVASTASPYWQELSAEEKEIYNKKARDSKMNSGKAAEKYNTLGMSCSYISREQEQIKNAKKMEEETIRSYVVEAYADQTLAEKPMCLVHTNYLCCPLDGSFVTCEVGASVFNIRNGILMTYHNMVDAKIPLGYAFHAQEKSEKLGLSIPITGLKRDYIYLKATFTAFMEDFKNNLRVDGKIVVFAMPDDIDAVTNFFEQMCAAVDSENVFFVYSFINLYFEIRNVIAKGDDIGVPTLAIALTQLKVDAFEYNHGLSCDWHRDGGLYPECSLSRTQRMIFMLCDNVCKHLGIRLDPGKHIPMEIDVNRLSQACSKAETQSSQSSVSEADSHKSEQSKWFASAGTSDVAASSSNSQMETHEPETLTNNTNAASAEVTKERPWSSVAATPKQKIGRRKFK